MKNKSEVKFKKKISCMKLPFEEICRIGENVAAFSSQVTDMQRNVIESSNNSGSRVTSSPGAMQPKNKNMEMCKPFSLYIYDTVTSRMKEGLYSFLESVGDSFNTIGTKSARDVLFYGGYGTKRSQSQK